MTVSAEVSMIKKVAAGQGISYNHSWVAPHDTIVAVLPCGYADGVPRVLSNRFEVWIAGRRFPGVGRVCMDQLVVDLGPDGAGVVEGDRAVLFGTGARGEPTAHEWACGHDCGLGGRITTLTAVSTKSAYSTSMLRSSRLRILPVGLRGSSARKTTSRGTL